MRCIALVFVVLALGSAGRAEAAPKKATTVVAKTEKTVKSGPSENDPLPAAARELLVSRMRNHRVDMNLLMRAVLLLDHEDVARLATRIATETQLAKPLPGEVDQINSLVPPKFFALQDRLQEETRALGKAASVKDDAALGKSFGRVVESCVACHASYLEPSMKTPE